VISIAANVVVLNDHALDPCPVCGVSFVVQAVLASVPGLVLLISVESAIPWRDKGVKYGCQMRPPKFRRARHNYLSPECLQNLCNMNHNGNHYRQQKPDPGTKVVFVGLVRNTREDRL
jgi:hypothetical protein